MNQQQANLELHQKTVEVLLKVLPHVTAEELGLLCFHAQIPPKELQSYFQSANDSLETV